MIIGKLPLALRRPSHSSTLKRATFTCVARCAVDQFPFVPVERWNALVAELLHALHSIAAYLLVPLGFDAVIIRL